MYQARGLLLQTKQKLLAGCPRLFKAPDLLLRMSINHLICSWERNNNCLQPFFVVLNTLPAPANKRKVVCRTIRSSAKPLIYSCKQNRSRLQDHRGSSKPLICFCKRNKSRLQDHLRLYKAFDLLPQKCNSLTETLAVV